MLAELLADVAVRATLETRVATLTYRIPPRLQPFVQPGQLVWVPLRRQQVQGVVLSLFEPEEHPAAGLREIADLGDPEAAITPAGLQLARWIANTQRASLYEVLALLLPPGTSQQSEVTWRPTALGQATDLGALPIRERSVLYYLRRHGEMSERELRRELRGSDSELLTTYGDLLERGLLARGATLSAPRAQPRLIRLARLNLLPAEVETALTDLARAPKQQAVLRWLAEQPAPEGDDLEQYVAVPVEQIYAATHANAGVLRQLEQKGFLAFESREVRRDPLVGNGITTDVPPPLTPGQSAAWQQIAAALETSAQFSALSSQRLEEPSGQQSSADTRTTQLSTEYLKLRTFLLHGVTGSGKTEVYLRAIGRALRLGRQTLVLVPEIALTTQLVRRFAARFPGQIAVLHSGLSLGQRYDEWRRLRRGDARVAIGSRSAVFAPLPSLGLIIVDEEHEPTYKHDSAPRYHARDAALQLGAITNSVVILGSATPSVESYYAAQTGRYTLLQLRERVGSTSHNGLPRSKPLPLPPVQIVDMRRELQGGNRSIFSNPLQEAIDKTLERRAQVILFLNRRGAASFIMCRDCGHVVSCPACSGPLTVHYEDAESNHTENAAVVPSDPAPIVHSQSSLLVCHSCNHRELLPSFCPQCLSTRIKAFGVGTQRVEEEVQRLFPNARVLRWDRDSVGRKGSHQRLLDAFLNHEADVLVGTQMIAKGLDLPLVSLVGVVAADTGLHLPDFRSGERAFQLLTQVAGRAGRRTTGAQVILQSYLPEHYALQAARDHDYPSFYEQEIAFRRQTGYPPFGRLVRFVYSSGSEERCRREAHELAVRLSALLNARAGGDELGIIGPAPAFMQRVRGRYRWHLMLRAPNPAPLLDALGPLPGWMVDVDPVSVM